MRADSYAEQFVGRLGNDPLDQVVAQGTIETTDPQGGSSFSRTDPPRFLASRSVFAPRVTDRITKQDGTMEIKVALGSAGEKGGHRPVVGAFRFGVLEEDPPGLTNPAEASSN